MNRKLAPQSSGQRRRGNRRIRRVDGWCPLRAFDEQSQLLSLNSARQCSRTEATFPGKNDEDDYSAIRDEIEAVIPGFDRFNERIAENVFYLPNGRGKNAKTKSGKANFTVNDFELFNLPPGYFVLTTIRSQDNSTLRFTDSMTGCRRSQRPARSIHKSGRRISRGWLAAGSARRYYGHFEGAEEREAQHFLAASYSIPRDVSPPIS